MPNADVPETSAQPQHVGPKTRSSSLVQWLQPSGPSGMQRGSEGDRQSYRRQSFSNADRIAELEQALSSGLSNLEERVAASEDSLKMRITQMEVAVMGALRTARPSPGGPAAPQRPTLQLAGAGRGAPGSVDAGSCVVSQRGSANDPSRPSARHGEEADASGQLGGTTGSEVQAEASAVGLAYAERTVQTVETMQHLVDGDLEVRAMLAQLRKQVQNSVSKAHALHRKPTASHMPITPSEGVVGGYGKEGAATGPTSGRPSFTTFQSTARLLGPVTHPEARFRMLWNFALALLIIYCGVAVPLEIAFEDDMIVSMCGERASDSKAEAITLPRTSAARAQLPARAQPPARQRGG